MQTQIHSTVQSRLKHIASSEPGTIRATVAKDALAYEDVAHFFNVLQWYGCVTGVARSLFFLAEIEAFYDEHFYEIEEFYVEYSVKIPKKITSKCERNITLTRLVFEEAAYRISIDDLGL